MGQAVKVKAETSPDLKLCLFWIPFNLTEQPRKPGPKTPRAEEEGRREKIKLNTNAAPKLLTAAVRTQLSSGVDFVERKKREKGRK